MSDPAINHNQPHGLRQLFSWRNGVAWGMLAFTLLVQLVVWQSLRTNEDRAARQQFQMLGEKVTEAIRKRLRDHEQILLGGAGLFDAVENVSREQWRTYVERLLLPDRYPGIQGVGFSQAIPQAERDAHVAHMRAQGYPDYDIHPPGQRELYTSIVYLEPFLRRNLAAFGYDMYSEPTRRRAMQRAAQLGETSITGKVTLLQETHGKVQAGVLLYVPVYRPSAPLTTPEQRMQALRGFVYSPYRVEDLMRGILRAADLPLALHIYASPGEEPEHLLYASSEAPEPGSARFSQLQQLELYGQTWTLRMDSRPEFDERFHSNEALVFGLGLGLSLLVFFLTSSLALRHSRAQALANEMTRHIRQSKHDLRLSEERLSLALKGSNDGLWDLDLEAGSMFASPRAWEMLGYRPNELTCDLKLWERLTVAEDLAQQKARLAQTMLSNVDHFTTELRLQHKHGHVVPVLLRGHIQRDPQGMAQRISGTLMDLTERKRVEQMKNDFVSTVSHELRTPLTSISGALGLIVGGALGAAPPAMQQMLEIAYRNSLRLGHLINDLLDMEKIAAGKMSFELREHSLGDLLEESLASNQALCEQHGVRCTLEHPTDVLVWVDGLRLQQVLGNFLSNAVKFTPEGGEIRLHSSLRGTKVRISVTDQGPGIPEAFRSRVFEKFAQADASDSRQKSGTGLGLAITKELIERMGGTVGFDCVPGQGTTFWCELPIQIPPAESDCRDGQPRILVVEDEPDTGRLLHMMLREGGYGVERVQSLHQAREKLAASHYEAMTLDLHLPDGSGMQLIDELRDQPAMQDLPIVVISAAHQFEQAQFPAGIVWLHKPITNAQLLVAVEQARDNIRQARSKPR
ncbi:PAS domain-containing protein [Stutzerimonas stutzeri]|jgi:PAS domain S-box-containing protein|uniref:hybrid sensor histidine kinase/response regulator n=1 Tax=Stutzerimonas stutzeri subgroup TaxID=578833 RepID=UPI00062788CF|nr:CHASE domain-containing protein [Stutzerimonas kunmingensis]KKJ98576.1 PAS domain-containing protein [Stutzerimonas stutzeri]MBD3874476.1 CHASE domain-containing protein [Stutzerimonas kunmingensis]HAG78844.1 hybrid sensor histidine kinase/response regulator [Pseudomonas sp.]|tara:strand:- start:3762 stop:6332 length:2571 start_codon:yes stop_codon:yes gene_type:complete